MVKILKHYYNYSYIGFGSETGDAFIIDPSWNFENIHKNLEDLNLKAVFLTHHHFDHVNLVEKIVDRWNVPVYISREEIDFYNFKCKNIKAAEDGEYASAGSLSVKCILTPGHTKGGMCYYTSGSLFTGDTIFIEGCGMCNLEGGDPHEMFLSIQKIRNSIPEETLIYPGHSYGESPGKTIKFLLNNNIYFSFTDLEKFVNFRMRKHQKGLFNFK